MIRYSADDERILSFSKNAKAKIFSKEAGNRLDLWEAEVSDFNSAFLYPGEL